MSAYCKSCSAPIVWAQTASGRSMPLNADPVAHGNVTIVGWLNPSSVSPTPLVAVGQLALDQTPVDDRRWVSHFSTCRFAGAHRRGRPGCLG